MPANAKRTQHGSVFVFAADPMVTVTVQEHGGDDDIHFHAGGQGVWISRMVASLGVPVTLCGALLADGYATVTALNPVCAASAALQSANR